MTKNINLFAAAVTMLFFVVSLIFREKNIYTQGAWALLIITLAMNTGFQLKNKAAQNNSSEQLKHLAYAVFLAFFYTILLLLGLGESILG